MTIALSDPWDINGFEEKRQGLLNSIVACAPKQAAPYVALLKFGKADGRDMLSSCTLLGNTLYISVLSY